MSLLDGFKRLFGEGKIRVEGETIDGQTFNCKIPYIGDPSTLDVTELFAHVCNNILVENGKTVNRGSLRIVGMTK